MAERARGGWLPKRMVSPLWRVKMYIEFRAGMPDPARQARRERMRRLSARVRPRAGR